MITYRTESGSVYDVAGNMVRRRVRSDISRSERVSGEWREAVRIDYAGLGHPLVIIWGAGRDEHSDNADKVMLGTGPWIDESRLRTTVTTPVMAIIESPALQ